MGKFKKMSKADLNRQVEARMEETIKPIVEKLEAIAAGKAKAGSWKTPWIMSANSRMPVNFAGKEYAGLVNSLSLMLAQENHGYKSNKWVTYNRAKQMGLKITNPKEYCWVFYNDKKSFTKENEAGEKEVINYWFYKSDHVYNLSNTDAVIPKVKPVKHNPDKRIKEIDQFAANTGAVINEKDQSKAFYSPSKDAITLPKFKQFDSAACFAQTKLHELVHWTGHEKRENRLRKGMTFGSDEYAFEELVAELGSTVCLFSKGYAPCGLQHEEYILSWLKALKDNPKFLFKAGAKATRAIAYLDSLQKAETKAA